VTRHIVKTTRAHHPSMTPRDAANLAGEPREPTAVSSFVDAETSKPRVRVHVYDLNADFNQYSYPLGVGGIFHSGCEIESFGREYAFGYHDEAGETGVFDIAPRTAPPPAKFRETIEMGECKLSREETLEALDALRREFTGPSYDLLKRNCNSFTEALVERLTGKTIPGYINRLATIGSVAHDYAPCILPRSIVGDVRTLPGDAKSLEERREEETEAGGKDSEQVQLLACPVEEMK